MHASGAPWQLGREQQDRLSANHALNTEEIAYLVSSELSFVVTCTRDDDRMERMSAHAMAIAEIARCGEQREISPQQLKIPQSAAKHECDIEMPVVK